MRSFSILFISSLLAVSACESEVDGKPKAKVADAKEVKKDDAKPDAKPDAAAAKLAVDTAASKIGFVGAKVTGDHAGSFGTFEGSATLAGDETTALEFTVDMQSLAIEPEGLKTHLLGPDFFDVEKHGKASFQSTSITEKAGEGGSTHEVVGNLTLRGTAKSVTFPAKLAAAGDKVTGSTEFSINRKDFGIVYAGKADDLIKDDVLLKIDLAFPRK